MKKIAIPKCLLLSFMTIIVFNVANAQKPQSRYRILTYGLPNFLRQNAEDVIANKWGIEFYPVGDCLTPRAIADSADKHNATVEAQIAQKYGQQWKKQFYKEVDEEFVRQQKIIALAESIDYVKKKKKEMEANEQIFYNLLTPIPHTNKYDVQIRGWEKYNGEDIFFRFFQFEADYKTNRIKLISDKKEKHGDKRSTEQ